MELQEVFDLIYSHLSNVGVTLVNIDTKSSPVTYYIDISKKNMVLSLEETLSRVYRILWSLTYGSPDDKNKNSKIELKYQEVE